MKNNIEAAGRFSFDTGRLWSDALSRLHAVDPHEAALYLKGFEATVWSLLRSGQPVTQGRVNACHALAAEIAFARLGYDYPHLALGYAR
jgi:hypothetical protein